MFNFATLLIGGVLLGVVVAITAHLWKNRNKGCGGNCSGCGMDCNTVK